MIHGMICRPWDNIDVVPLPNESISEVLCDWNDAIRSLRTSIGWHVLLLARIMANATENEAYCDLFAVVNVSVSI